MMKKFLKRTVLCFLIVLCLAPTCMAAFAADTLTVPMTVQYGQTEARTMLTMINDFRTGDDAWCWDSSDTNKVYQTDLAPLTYDYGLEQIAMLRAAEIAASFSHTRPNGESCFTATVGSCRSWGENIAAGQVSAASAFTSWQETDDDYSGQGHRRNMLNGSFTHIGIGHAYVNGRHYWVQEFARSASGIASAAADDSKKTVHLEVNGNSIKSQTAEVTESLRLSLGERVDLPTATVKLLLKDAWPEIPVTFTVTPDWTVSGGSVSVSGGKLVANSAGNSALTASVYGQTVTVSVSVSSDCNHQWGDWTVKKAPACTEAGTETRRCSVCQTEETRTVEATGHKMGDFQVVKEATEEETGLEERSCSVCGEKEQHVIPKLSDVLPGDANGDGKVDAKDFLKARRAFFGLIPLTESQLKAIDFNGNGKLDAAECIKLQRAIFGLATL